MRAPMEVAENLLQQLPNLKVIDEHFLEFAEHVIILTTVCMNQTFYRHCSSPISNKFISPTTPQKKSYFFQFPYLFICEL